MRSGTSSADNGRFILSIRFSLPALVLICVHFTAAAQQHANDVSQAELAEYRSLNDKETRLPEYKDSVEMLYAKIRQLHYINSSRERNGSPPVELDILASRAANRMASEAAQVGFQGHWNTRGEKPYHRFSFAGGLSHVSENAAAVHTTGKFDQSIGTIEKYMRDSHDRFMAEKPPHDGHWQTVLDPVHTAVGIGAAITTQNFRYYEEYVDRYLNFLSYTKSLSTGESTTITVKPLLSRYLLQAVIVYYEAPLKPLTPAQINSRGSYPDFSQDVVTKLWPFDLEKSADGSYSFKLSFKKEGLYYVQMYLGTQAFTGGSFTTSGKIQASGLVLRVE